MSKTSFVIDIAHTDTFEDDVLKQLDLTIVTEESDIYLGYYTVIGTEENIVTLREYLAGNIRI